MSMCGTGSYAAGTMYANFKSWHGVRKAADELARSVSLGQLPALPKLPKLTTENPSGREATETNNRPQIDADQHRPAQARVPVPHEPGHAFAQEEREGDKAIAL